jgi:hypothetical protein
MRRQVLAAGLAVLVFTPALRATDEPPEKAKTPRQRYQALVEEYQKAMQQFMDVYQKAKTAEEREKLVREKYPNSATYARRCLEIAESAPQDAAAVDALIWIVQNGRATTELNQAIDRLATSHAGDRKLGEIAPRLAYSLSPSAETLLRAIVEKNPDREVKGRACLALGQFFKQQSELVRMLKADPKRAQEIEQALTAQGGDKALLAQLRQNDPDALTRQSEPMFERAAREFADVSNGRNTVGKAAQAELNEIRNLGIGKPAPEISGEDIDGKPFKLSDYKGKVVVVDFWGDW